MSWSVVHGATELLSDRLWQPNRTRLGRNRMKRTRDKIIDHFLLGPVGVRYRTLLALIIAALVNLIFFPGNKYVFVAIMGLYTVFGLTGIETRLIKKWRGKR